MERSHRTSSETGPKGETSKTSEGRSDSKDSPKVVTFSYSSLKPSRSSSGELIINVPPTKQPTWSSEKEPFGRSAGSVAVPPPSGPSEKEPSGRSAGPAAVPAAAKSPEKEPSGQSTGSSAVPPPARSSEKEPSGRSAGSAAVPPPAGSSEKEPSRRFAGSASVPAAARSSEKETTGPSAGPASGSSAESTARPLAAPLVGPSTKPTGGKGESVAATSSAAQTEGTAKQDASGRCCSVGLQCLLLWILLGIVLGVAAALPVVFYLKSPPAAPHAGPLKTVIRRGSLLWHGYGPQLLVCTLGEMALATEATFPEDGVCDLILYTHVAPSLGCFEDRASSSTKVKENATSSNGDNATAANVGVFWARAKIAKNTRFGYSISVSLLPVEEDALGEFIQKAVRDRNMGAFGMLDAPWSVNTSKLYVEFVTALNATARKLLPVDNQPVLVFGLNTGRTTTIEYDKFWESHAAIFDQVHVLIYQDHFELERDAAGKCEARLPASRFPQSDATDQTVQDSVEAMDLALKRFWPRPLPSDVCLSVSLSVHRYHMGETAVKIGGKCESASVVSYDAVCRNVSVDSSPPSGEGVVTVDQSTRTVDAFDTPETLVEKLRTAKHALALSAQPHWSFCVAAFHLELEDSEGTCGCRFPRLVRIKDYLRGALPSP